MQREIEFRGQRVDTKEWVYGCLIKCGITGKFFIFPYGNDVNESDKVGEEGCLRIVTFEVVPETIGQYTGLKDKNGKEIWESDIVRFVDGIKINGSTIHQSAVKWVDELSGFYIHAECVGYYQVNPSQCAMYHYEVIDNIYDNTEPLT